MSPEEQELILAELHEWIATHHELLAESLQVVKQEGISRYPILLVTRREGLDLGRWGVRLPTTGAWRTACTTLERWVAEGFLSADRVDDFRALYKSKGLGQACVMLLDSEANSSCVFVNFDALAAT